MFDDYMDEHEKKTKEDRRKQRKEYVEKVKDAWLRSHWRRDAVICLGSVCVALSAVCQGWLSSIRQSVPKAMQNNASYLGCIMLRRIRGAGRNMPHQLKCRRSKTCLCKIRRAASTCRILPKIAANPRRHYTLSLIPSSHPLVCGCYMCVCGCHCFVLGGRDSLRECARVCFWSCVRDRVAACPCGCACGQLIESK